MKKRILLSMALLATAITAGSMPLTTQAAGLTKVSSNSRYQVYIGQGTESLYQTLEELGISIKNIGNLCPDISIPGTGTPDTPSTDDPGTQEPDTSVPDNGSSDETELSYAEQVAALVNEERAKAGLPALEMSTEITAAANVRAKEIKQSFSHTRPDGSSFSTALKEQGVSYRGSGENIAWGQKSPEQVMKGWMNSEGHRANILNKNFKNIGVGYYQDANGVNYWVQLFTY